MRKIFAVSIALALLTVLCASCTNTNSPESASIPPKLDDYWVENIAKESLQKIEEELPVNYKQNLNPFKWGFGSGPDKLPKMGNLEAVERYTKNTLTIEGKIVVGEWVHEEDPAVQTRYDSYKSSFYIVEDLSERLTDTTKIIDPAFYAGSIEECDYLIVFGGFESDRDREYYKGGADRVEITTLVLVFDAREKELLHLKSLGTFLPNWKTNNPVGLAYVVKVYEYIISLMAGMPSL